ncbi:MAG: hypothetical protein WD490_04335, partial [Opitutales bacterium]
MKKRQTLVAIILGSLLAGCATTQPTSLTPLEIQERQTRTYEAGKEVVFPSAVSVFQDLGYSIQTADIQS